MPRTPDVKVVGRILRQARRRAGLTQEQLAAESGLSQIRISRLELGQVPNPGIRELVAIADVDAIDLDLDDLAAPFAPRPNSRRRPQPSLAVAS